MLKVYKPFKIHTAKDPFPTFTPNLGVNVAVGPKLPKLKFIQVTC